MRRQVEHNPRDGRAWALLAMLEFEADRFERAVSTSPKVAADPAVRCEYADALGMAQGGSLAGRPTELIGCAPTTPSDRDGRQRRLRAAWLRANCHLLGAAVPAARGGPDSQEAFGISDDQVPPTPEVRFATGGANRVTLSLA
jgi:hypothetical protein